MAQVPLSAEQASHSRDALARSLYVLAPLEKNTRARTHTHLRTPVTDGIVAMHPSDHPRRDGVLCIAFALALRVRRCGFARDMLAQLSQGWSRVVICCTGLARVP